MTNFLADYMHYASGNEVPENYHLWSAINALSAIISRRVWIDLGYFQITPNLYIVLVGPPGNGKTTALNIAKSLIRELGTIPYSAEAQTKESVVKEMQENERAFDYNGTPLRYTPLAVYVTELSHFLGPNAGHMIDFLTTVYDLIVYDCKTKNKGNDLIYGPYVTVLSCTTGAWITNYLRSDIISGGFSRRAIFVNEVENKRRIPFPEIQPSQVEAWERVKTHAKTLLSVGGQFQWHPDAKKWYHDWYMHREIAKDPTIHCYSKTKSIQLLKVGMLVSLATSTDLILRVEPLKVALAMLDGIESLLPAVFQGMGRNELNDVASKVVDIIHSCEYIPKKRLEGLMFRECKSTNEFYYVLKHLVDNGQAVCFSMKLPGSVEKEYVATPDMAKQIQERLSKAANEQPPQTP